MDASTNCPRCGSELHDTLGGRLCTACLLRDGLGVGVSPEFSEADDLSLFEETDGTDGTDGTYETYGTDVSPEDRGYHSPSTGCGRFGHYSLVREIARGGMGIVYEAFHRPLRRTVALKLLLHGSLSCPQVVERFKRESRAAAGLQHPNIVRIHEVSVFRGQHYFTMDYVPGKDLGEVVSIHPLTCKEAAHLVHTLANAVHYAHEKGVIHRDLKPSNVLLNAFGQPCITDFGLAKLLDCDEELTLTGELLGSPSYTAPEQAMGNKAAVGVRSDVYSLGAILYSLISGKPPFLGDCVAATLYLVRHQEPVSLAQLNPSTDKDLEVICFKCLRKQAADRYNSAKELANDLDRYLHGKPIRARPISAWGQLRYQCRKHPVRVTLVCAVLFLLALGVAGSLGYAHYQHQARLLESDRREIAERARYVADVRLADHSLKEGHTGLARQLLLGLVPGPDTKDLRGFEWYRLLALSASQELFRIWDGPSPVLGMTVSPDGKSVALAFEKELIWLATTGGPPVFKIALPHSRRTRQLRVLTDNQTLVIGDDTGLHRARVGSPDLVTIHSAAVTQMAVCPEGRRVAITRYPDVYQAAPAALEVWEIASQILLHQQPVGGGPALCWDSDSRSVLTVNRQGALLKWDLEKNALTSIYPNFRPQSAASFSADGQWLALINDRGSLQIIRVIDREIIATVPGFPTRGVHMAFRADGMQLAISGAADQRLAVLQVPSGQLIWKWVGHEESLTGVHAHPLTEQFLTCSWDGTVRLWDEHYPEEEIHVAHPRGTHPRVPAVFSADNRWLAYATGKATSLPMFTLLDLNALESSAQTVKVAETGNRIPSTAIETRATQAGITESERHHYERAGSGRGKGKFVPGVPLHFEAANGRNSNPPALVLFMPDKGLFLHHADGTSHSVEPGLPIPAPVAVHSCGMSHHQWFTWITARRQIHSCHLPTGRSLEGPKDSVLGFALLKGKPLVALAFADTVALWDLEMNTVEPLIAASAEAFAFAPDQDRLAVGDVSGRIHLIDLTERTVTEELRGHASGILALAFTPDELSLVSSSDDRTVRFWNVVSGRELAMFPRENLVHSLEFSPNGDWLVLEQDRARVFWKRP